MSQIQNLVKKATLTEAELAEIELLTDLCNRYENLHMRLSIDILRRRPGDGNDDFLYYTDGILTGYLSLDNWGIEEREIVVMVHPDYRRRGIFRALLQAAQEDSRGRGIQRLILVCEQASASGQACVKAIAATLDFSEHEMVLENFQERNVFDERLVLRRAESRDLDVLVAIQAASFDESGPGIRARMEMHLHDPHCRVYLATFGEGEVSCEEPVGTLRLDDLSEVIGIYGFGIVPDYRGRGYGRQMLEEMIRVIRASSQKSIMLDVDTTNTVAIGLYTSCGFKTKTTYEYYQGIV